MVLLNASWLLAVVSGGTALAYNYGHHRPLAPRDYDNRVYYAVELSPHTTPADFLASRRGGGWTFEQQLGSLENHYLFSVAKTSEAAGLVEGIRDQPRERLIKQQQASSLYKRSERLLYKRDMEDHGVVALQILEPKRLYKRAPPPPPKQVDAVDSSMIPIKEAMRDLKIQDPEFRKQWHLINPSEPGHDLNITGVWRQGFTGKKAMAVAVVDDGLDYAHDDLKANYWAEGSYDFNDQRENPRPELDDDRHGTRCAGEIAAVRNDVCGVGVAYDGKVAGIRILSGPVSEADEALALNYGMDSNGIYSCSWGPPDDGRSVAEPGMVVRKAMLNGVQNGRGKKGSIFVFASGNGGMYGDNCNFDGYTNSIYSITVAAIDRKGMHPPYSEACSANMVVTYSSGSSDHIHTTDFHGGCTDRHGGTSAAAPIAAGVFSLVLEANPALTWRDLQYLAMDTAEPVNVDEDGWQKTEIGKQYHHRYGYGKIDGYKIVERAKNWKNVKPQAWHFHNKVNVKQGFEYGRCAKSTVEVTKDELEKSNIERLEHVNVFLNINHEWRGAIAVKLGSPSGVVSNLLEPRYQDDSMDGLVGWTVMSVAHWGESGVGNWTISVCNNDKDRKNKRGEFLDWRLKLWGEAKDAEKQMLYPIPKHEDLDPDHREHGGVIKPTEPALGRVSKSHTHGSLQSAHSPSSSPTTAAASSHTKPAEENKASASTTSTAVVTPTTTHPHSRIPTFGLSSHTIAWVVGSFLLIAAFIGGIVFYLYMSKRKRRGHDFGYRKGDDPSSSMEFDLIPSRGDGEHDSDLEFDDEDEDDERAPLYHDRHDDDRYSSDETAVNKEAKSAGQKARTLYDTSAQSSTIFKVDDDEE